MIKTLKIRIKDKHVPVLQEMARSVNFVFNYVNELSARIIKEKSRFPNYYELEKYTAGSGKLLNLHSQTVQCIAKEYVQRRIQFKKRILKWRKSGGSKRSLGWIPFNTKAVAQRARNLTQVRNIHAKIKNRRLDALHKFTTTLVNNNAFIVIGDVSSTKLAKTKMAKSVYDAGWGIMKSLLEYKCANAGSLFLEVNERNTTRTCHSCKSLTGPQGLDGLRIRVWTCHVCGGTHERDINAAKNILAVGHDRLGEGILALHGGEDVKYNRKVILNY